MKKKITCLLLACGLALLGGCGKQAAEEIETKTEEASGDEPEVLTEEAAPAEEMRQQAEESAWPRELTNEELREFTMWINQGENFGNYGFLLSEYEKPQDIDLHELFYTGAGMECQRLSEEEQAAYLNATGQEEIYTDCTRLSTEQIDEFLQRRLGISYQEISHPLDWTYLPDYDVFVFEHGDTNYMNFTCVGGRQIDEQTYELDCVPGDDTYQPVIPSCRLTLRKTDEDYQPVSNIYVDGLVYSMDIWRIEDQCFEVELEGWGRVTFASYGQDKSSYGYKDAVFRLEQDGETVYQLPFVAEDNYRREEIFQNVLAVSFQDYDGDGDKDIIVIAEYESFTGDREGERFCEARLYRNEPKIREFVLDFDRMDGLNANQWNHTVSEVTEHLDFTEGIIKNDE